MKEELQKKLVEKYPDCFRGRNNEHSLIHFGLECDDGWYNIIDATLEAFTYLYKTSILITDEEFIKNNDVFCFEIEGKKVHSYLVEPPVVVLDQVKEKFGALRIYFHLEYDETFLSLIETEKAAQELASRYENYVDGIVHLAECLSARTCEITGLEGCLHSSGGWLKTLNIQYAANELKDRNYKIVTE
jgi:hypothetical protein